MTKNSQKQVSTAICAVGIDVSSDKLSIILRKDDESKEFVEIRNADVDIARFMKNSIAGYRGKIIMESTGRYHLLSAIKLTEAGFDARVINPLMSKKYSSSAIRKVKSDKRDAEVLAKMALVEEKLPSRFNLTRNTMEIRKKIALLGSLEKEYQRLSAIMMDYEETKKNLKLSLSKPEKNLRKMIAGIKDLQEDLEKEIITMAKTDPETAERAKRYKSIPGVSEYAAVIAASAFDKAVCEHTKQWVAFAGLDISVRESGKWKGKGRLTKRGNPYLRKRLFQAGWGAIMNNADFKKYYEDLRKNGRSYTESLVIISRKIVRIMFSLEKNTAFYDSSIIGSLNAN